MKKKVILSSLMLGLMALAVMGAMPSNAKVSAVSIELNSSTATVGFGVTVHLTGLTDGTCYIVDAVHSSGNVSAVSKCSGTEDYVKLGPFTSADADGVVPIHVSITTDYSTPGTAADTVLLTLEEASIPGADFFTGIISDLVLIAVVVGLLGVFIGGSYLYSKKRS